MIVVEVIFILELDILMDGRLATAMAILIMAAVITALSTDLTTVTAGVDIMILSFMIHGTHGVLAGAGAAHTGVVTTMATGMVIIMAITMAAAGDTQIMAVRTDTTDTEVAWPADLHIHLEVQEV